MQLRIFVSSVQKEFESFRRDLKAFLLGDAVLRRFVSHVFLFEELPARDQRADRVYLGELEKSTVYLGIFGYEYGSEDGDGLSPTEREFDRATELGITRLVYVWGRDEKRRSPKMKKLIHRAGDELVRRRVEDFNALTLEVYSSLVDLLDERGVLRLPPFDLSACGSATHRDISADRISWFLQTARAERAFPLAAKTAPKSLLTHLNLLDNGAPTNAAILLFGTNPQQFHRTAETKCVFCHGTSYQRPFASQQIYTGDLFSQADQAKDFVLSRINRTVGTRTDSLQAPATYELPPEAVGEAIVNAIAHRDYHSNGSVEVRLFSDRLEIWNPGRLPHPLTPALLREDHPSVPNNPLIAESLYLARYIEKAGSGTQAMIELCHQQNLPEPVFEQRGGSFVVTLSRDWLTDQLLAELGLNDRQKAAIKYVKQRGRITNTEYQAVTGGAKRTAHRDLMDLINKDLLKKTGTTGRGTSYVLNKGAIKGPKGP